MPFLAQVAPTAVPFGPRFRPPFGPGFRGGFYVVERHGWWWHFFAAFVPLLFFALLIGLLVWLVLRVSGRGAGAFAAGATVAAGPVRDPALEEVRLRYARGEMTREEFVQRSGDLGATTTPTAPPAEPQPARSDAEPPTEPQGG